MVAQKVSIFVRLLLAIGGGYVVSAGLTALAASAASVITTLPRSDAVVLASMAAFFVYLALLIWGFAERKLLRLCLVMIAISAISWGGSWGLVRPIG